MIRIRRVVDDASPEDERALASAVQLLETTFPDAPVGEFSGLVARLRDPFDKGFRTFVYVAEDGRGRMRGVAVASLDPKLHFVLLDWIAAGSQETGGVGSALFERLREDCGRLGAVGLLFECLSDVPEEVKDPKRLAQNVARLTFYERFGARPIVGTAYREPVAPDGDPAQPWLVFCPAQLGGTLSRTAARAAVRAILERKYPSLCPPAYVDRVVRSFRDDPVRLREPRYVAAPEPLPSTGRIDPSEAIALVWDDAHLLHHIRERGYVEAPARVEAIRSALEPSGLFAPLPPKTFPMSAIEAVHDPEYLRWLEAACAEVAEGARVYPYVFPVRNRAKKPDDRLLWAGYHCIDTFTPLHRAAWSAALGAAHCALTAASALSGTRRLSYALVRPPGHHAERSFFGGFCYLNNAAVAAAWLRARGAERVAILDVDYHHGNGQQEIFWERDDVFTVSIHGDPAFAYPYFCGFADEVGEGRGEGYNLNLPLPERATPADHRAAVQEAMRRIAAFDPDVVVVCLGLDTAAGDPTGSWRLKPNDFRANGATIGSLRRPVLVVQEGGYRLRSLGRCALAFFQGLHGAIYR